MAREFFPDEKSAKFIIEKKRDRHDSTEVRHNEKLHTTILRILQIIISTLPIESRTSMDILCFSNETSNLSETNKKKSG